jgi:hypothetical protein
MQGRRFEKKGRDSPEYVKDFSGRERRVCLQPFAAGEWHDSDRVLSVMHDLVDNGAQSRSEEKPQFSEDNQHRDGSPSEKSEDRHADGG